MQETLLTSTYRKFNRNDIKKQMQEMVGDDDIRTKIDEIPPVDFQLFIEFLAFKKKMRKG
jgi:hypothetical protein